MGSCIWGGGLFAAYHVVGRAGKRAVLARFGSRVGLQPRWLEWDVRETVDTAVPRRAVESDVALGRRVLKKP